MSDSFVQSDGVRIAVREYRASGSPFIFVHGGPGPNLISWDSFARNLDPRFRPITFDQRGHGQSDDAGDYSYDSLFRDIHAIINSLNLKEAVVVGHSWGGWVALGYASYYRDCRGVIAVDGCLHDHYPHLSASDWRRLEEGLRSDRYLRVLDFRGTEEELKDLALSTGFDFDVLRRDCVEVERGILANRHSIEHVLGLNRSVESCPPPPPEAYDSISCPVLLITATEGPFREVVKPIIARFPALHHRWVECGHAIQDERPLELAQIIAEFADSMNLWSKRGRA